MLIVELEKLIAMKDIIQDVYDFSIKVKNLNDKIQHSSEVSFEDKIVLVDKFNNVYKDTNYKKMHVSCDLQEWENSFSVNVNADISNIKVSIILPVYNKVNYGLAKGIQSCLSQTHKNIEVICVNDASTDDSLGVIEYFASIDSRVVIVNFEENKNCFEARLTGWNIATGDYITSVDPDDWIDEGYIEEALKHIVKFNVDVVGVLQPFREVEDRIYYGYVGDMPFLSEHWSYGDISVNVCGKIYKNSTKKSLKNIKNIPYLHMADDALLNTFLLEDVKVISQINLVSKYHYEINLDSVTKKEKFNIKMNDVFYVSNMIRAKNNSFFVDRNAYNHMLVYFNMNRQNTNIYERMKFFSSLDKETLSLMLTFMYEGFINSQSHQNQMQLYYEEQYRKYKIDTIISLIKNLFPAESIRRDFAKIIYKILKKVYKYCK